MSTNKRGSSARLDLAPDFRLRPFLAWGMAARSRVRSLDTIPCPGLLACVLQLLSAATWRLTSTLAICCVPHGEK